MRKNNCEVIRRELDELMLDDACSPSATEHLRECSACLEFHQKQTKLRQIVGGLGTIEAPADFDFRLRARLANDSSKAAFYLNSAYWPFARRGLAVAALLIVFATGVVLVRNVVNQQGPVEVIAEKNQPVQKESPKPPVAPQPKEQVIPEQALAGISDPSPQQVKTERRVQAGSKGKRSTVALEFGSQRAEVITGLDPAAGSDGAGVFPIDASLQFLRVSLDDGRGNARTISVPTIRFGSQRMLPNGNQFAPKGVW